MWKNRNYYLLQRKKETEMVYLEARHESGKRIWGVSFAFHFWLDNKEIRKNKKCVKKEL